MDINIWNLEKDAEIVSSPDLISIAQFSDLFPLRNVSEALKHCSIRIWFNPSSTRDRFEIQSLIDIKSSRKLLQLPYDAWSVFL